MSCTECKIINSDVNSVEFANPLYLEICKLVLKLSYGTNTSVF